MFQFAIGHAILWHAERLINVDHLRSAPVIDAEGKRLVAFQFPFQPLQAFACHALIAVILGQESHEFWWVLILRQILFLHRIASDFKDTGEITVVLFRLTTLRDE